MSEIEKDGAAPYRLPTGGRIDRGATLRFTFGGRTLTGHPGDTLASALLAHGVHQTGTSIKLGRPRGIAAAWAEDPNSLVQVEEPFPEPMLLATTIELTDGLAAHGIPGQGRLADVPDSARYDARHVHADLLVVGAGPTGLTAALTAARAGARVVLVDEQSEAGGSLLGTDDRIDGSPALEWVQRATAELAGNPLVVHLQRTTAFGHFDDGFVLALERRTDHLGAAAPRHLSRQRVWRIRARRVLVAAGAHERPVVFADNDRPGIMLAGGARTFLHRYGVLAGRTAVVFTTDDSAYAAAVDLADAGAEVRAVVDARPEPPAQWVGECVEPWHPGPRRAGRHGHGRRRAGERRTGGAAPRRRARGVGAHRLRPAAGERWLEPRGAPVQPGGRPAALRRRARGVRPGRRAGPDERRRGRRPGSSTSPAASPTVARAAAAALADLGVACRRRDRSARRRCGPRARRPW